MDKHFLVKLKRSDYKIVADLYADWKIRYATNELVLFFERATGIKLPIINESQIKDIEKGGYIFVGKGKYADEMLKKKKLNKDKLTTNGYLLKTENGNVYCIGGDHWGTLYSVYKFLNVVFGFRVYTYDEIKFEQNVIQKELPEIDLVDVPDIEWRAESWGILKSDRDFCLRTRLHSLHDIWIHVDEREDGFCHNTQLFIPFTEENRSKHPDWFNKDGTEICFSSDGAKEEIIRRLKEHLIVHPDVNNVTITQSDGAYNWCNCEKCKASKEKYGSDSAAVIKFCNSVSKEIQAWFKEQGVDRKLNIAMFAYGATRMPPTYVDEDVMMDDNVSLLFCGAPHGGNFFTDEKDEALKKQVEGWKIVAKHINFWTYSANFWSYFNFINTFEAMPSVYQYVKGLGARFILDNAQSYNTEHPGFCYLKIFLQGELQWNTSADMEALIDEFFDNYFKKAAKPMRELFDSMREHYSHFFDIPRCNINQLNETPENFPLEKLKMWNEKIKEAIALMAPPYGSLCPNYPAVYDRIILESITVRYLLMKIYPQAFTTEELVKEHESFKIDVRRMGIKFYNEWVTSEDFLLWLI